MSDTDRDDGAGSLLKAFAASRTTEAARSIARERVGGRLLSETAQAARPRALSLVLERPLLAALAASLAVNAAVAACAPALYLCVLAALLGSIPG